MASSNFLPWGPASGSAIAETDAEYLADVNRVNGAPLDSIFQSALANKLFQQVTAMCYALAQFMVAQGFPASDASVGTLAANLAGALAKISAPAIVETAFSSTPVFLAPSVAPAVVTFEITLTGNVTSSSWLDLSPGQIVIWVIHQNSAGGHTFVWPPGTPGALIDPTANKTSTQAFILDITYTLHPLGALTSS